MITYLLQKIFCFRKIHYTENNQVAFGDIYIKTSNKKTLKRFFFQTACFLNVENKNGSLPPASRCHRS